MICVNIFLLHVLLIFGYEISMVLMRYLWYDEIVNKEESDKKQQI